MGKTAMNNLRRKNQHKKAESVDFEADKKVQCPLRLQFYFDFRPLYVFHFASGWSS